MFKKVGCSRLALISLVVTGTMLADGSIQSAGAQCAPDAKIYIDPRLVPRRPRISPEAYQSIMTNPMASDAMKANATAIWQSQNQPIQVPFSGGMVLISASDPCVQQYIGPG